MYMRGIDYSLGWRALGSLPDSSQSAAGLENDDLAGIKAGLNRCSFSNVRCIRVLPSERGQPVPNTRAVPRVAIGSI